MAVKRRNISDTADIALGAITQVALKNCAPFENCTTEINDIFVDKANFINIAMPMHNLIEYSDNYFDTSGSLWGFKRDEVTNNANVTNDDNAPSFKYNASNIGDTENIGTKNEVKIDVPLKYLSNFGRSLAIPLINCKVELSLKWIENCVLTTAAIANNATFQITDPKLYDPVITLSAEDNVELVKQLSEGFKISVYWSKYKVTDNRAVKIADANEEKYIRELLNSSYQGVKDCLFLLMIIQKVIIEFLIILIKNIFFQELKLRTTTSKLMEKTFMISHEMTPLSNMMKSDKYQQDKVTITQLVVC